MKPNTLYLQELSIQDLYFLSDRAEKEMQDFRPASTAIEAEKRNNTYTRNSSLLHAITEEINSRLFLDEDNTSFA